MILYNKGGDSQKIQQAGNAWGDIFLTDRRNYSEKFRDLRFEFIFK